MKVLTIVGARPQFIKAAVVSREFQRHRKLVEVIVHTGQHYDFNMSDVFFDELSIPKPHYNLGIGGGTHGENTGRMLEAIERTIIHERPDYVLVYGDTDSTLAGALAASKLHVPVAHIEAGLRSFNMKMPEEINRRLTDHLSSLLFAPTDVAVENLKNEGVQFPQINKVGDVMYDAALYYRSQAEIKSTLLAEENLKSKEYFLLTIHRQENADSADNLKSIFKAFERVSSEVVCPLHPRTKAKLKDFNIIVPKNVRLIQPVGYFDMICLEANAHGIFTDSGGVQKEAFFHGVPCVTLRTETEWTELVKEGWNELVIPSHLATWVENNMASYFESDRKWRPIYGNGQAGIEIVDLLERKLKN